MDRFQAMQIFTRVVDANSFSHAADSLGLPRSTVSSTIQRLEQNLGVRLLNRTTRRLSLTPDGAAYYERCTQLLAELEDLEASFRDVTRGPRGRLRVEMKASIGRLILVPALCDFHARYPDIELAIGMSDRAVDMVREAVDCAIRVGELQDSSLVARRIGTFESITCAAPSYLERHGEPLTIDDLEGHRAVHYLSDRTGRIVDWSFMVDGRQRDVQVKGMVSVNDGEAYVKCGLKGFGMIQAPRYMVAPYIESGELKEVLSQWTPPAIADFGGVSAQSPPVAQGSRVRRLGKRIVPAVPAAQWLQAYGIRHHLRFRRQEAQGDFSARISGRPRNGGCCGVAGVGVPQT